MFTAHVKLVLRNSGSKYGLLLKTGFWKASRSRRPIVQSWISCSLYLNPIKYGVVKRKHYEWLQENPRVIGVFSADSKTSTALFTISI